MTEAQKELYTKTKERFRRLGKENPADVILGLAEEVEYYRSRIRTQQEELDKLNVFNKLHEADIADLLEQLEKKVEEVYPEFMRDYKVMREELDGVYDELEEKTKELQKYQSQAAEIIKAVYAYLCNVLEEWRRLPDDRRHETGNIQVYNHTRTEMDDLRELAYKYGVDLDEEVQTDG